jgi:hypothetical protein
VRWRYTVAVTRGKGDVTPFLIWEWGEWSWFGVLGAVFTAASGEGAGTVFVSTYVQISVATCSMTGGPAV